MNVKDFIINIQKKPMAFVHEVRLDYLEYVIEGVICMIGQTMKRGVFTVIL